jgi:hypothetical protein
MIDHYHGETDFQNCFIAVNKDGEIGAASLVSGFEYSVWTEEGERFQEAPHIIES